jgi:hypothetical protein
VEDEEISGHNRTMPLIRRGDKSARLVFPVILAVLASCGLIPRKTTMDDPQVQRLVKAAQSFDRKSDINFADDNGETPES